MPPPPAPARISPLLLMPPEALVTLVIEMPAAVSDDPVIEVVPPLVMPPETVAVFATNSLVPTAIPILLAVIVPLLLIAPPTELLSMVMPFWVGAVLPFALMLPALLTLPVTVKLFWILMQLTVAPLGLLTVAAEPGPVRVMAQLSAKADVELPPMTKAKIEVDASNTLRPASPTRICISNSSATD